MEKKSTPSERQPAILMHKDCYYGSRENDIKWREAPPTDLILECGGCGLPVLEGQVAGLVPLKKDMFATVGDDSEGASENLPPGLVNLFG